MTFQKFKFQIVQKIINLKILNIDVHSIVIVYSNDGFNSWIDIMQAISPLLKLTFFDYVLNQEQVNWRTFQGCHLKTEYNPAGKLF